MGQGKGSGHPDQGGCGEAQEGEEALKEKRRIPAAILCRDDESDQTIPAVASDERLDMGVSALDLNDAKEVADFIEKRFLKREESPMELMDNYGRRINYLRLSVTDRCNLRCSYCMPAEGVEKLAHRDILSYEELLRVARAAVAVGIEKIRVTGGEPLVRKGIVPFMGRLAAIAGLRQLVLTTNGVFLPEMAEGLRKAGVQRLNISLDSLKASTFATITRTGDVQRVLEGITAAERAGFPPVKINMVVMRGVNDDEILDFARLTLDRPYTVRFIEYMPVTREENWQALSVPGKDILDRIAAYFPLEPAEKGELSGPAREYRIRGSAGTIGVITAVSGHFCSDCNRIRVTSTGVAKSCLFSSAGIDLKPLLRQDDAAGLKNAMRRVVGIKPGKHGMTEKGADHEAFAMSMVGG